MDLAAVADRILVDAGSVTSSFRCLSTHTDGGSSVVGVARAAKSAAGDAESTTVFVVAAFATSLMAVDHHNRLAKAARTTWSMP